MPTAQEVLAELEALGTEQTRKTYRRRGISGDMYGVSSANLGVRRKRLKIDHLLARIERDISAEKNRVRQAMNNALIAIGMRNDMLETRALAVAKAIGKVQVDHGDTNCKTPHATAYIRKGRDRQRARAAQVTPA